MNRRNFIWRGGMAAAAAVVARSAAAGEGRRREAGLVAPDGSFDPARWVDDIAIVNARIITLDSRKPTAQAVLVRRGRIAAVGTNEDIRRAGRGVSIFDAGGRTVVPGFVDTHAHVDWSTAAQTLLVDLRGADTMAEVLQLMRVQAEKTPPGQWVRGLGRMIEKDIAEKRLPTIEELDAITQQHPLIVFGTVHTATANTYAARLLGYATPLQQASARWWSTREPFANNHIARDAQGRANDVTDWTFQRLPEDFFSVEELKGTIRKNIGEMFVAKGTTSVCDMGIVGNVVHSAEQELHASGELPLRIRAYHVVPHNVSLQSVIDSGTTRGFGNDMFRFGGVKFFFTLNGRDGNRPYFTSTFDEHLENLTLLHARGLPSFNHANGDPDAAVSVLEKLAQRFPNGPVLHHRLEHIVLAPELGRRLKAVGGRFSIIAKRREGEKAYPDGQRPAPLRTYVQEDMRPVLVSDQCDGPPLMEPIYGVAAACNTVDDGGSAAPDQTVGFDDALRMFTLWAAESSHEDHDRGSIAVGKLGDFAVLSADPARLKGTQLFDLRVQATILGGTVVHGA